MKLISLIVAAILVWSCGGPKPVEQWSDQEINNWCAQNEWFTSLPSTPFEGINKRTFAEQYHKNKAEWDAAFQFLKEEEKTPHEFGRYQLTDRTYANVETYTTKDVNRYEAHRKYIDVQYVLSGEEDIEVCELEDLRDVIFEYDETKDIGLSKTATKFERYAADSTQYLILFPSDGHNPCLTRTKTNVIRKICVKVPFD